MYDYNCDIKLNVVDEVFRAHKDVLSKASDYFSVMFSVDMLEKGQDAIELHDISPQGFSSMLEYFYHGHVTLTADCASDVLEAARFFHIEWLMQVCCDFFIRNLGLENFEAVLQLAEKYVLGDLRSEIFKYLSTNFSDLCSSPRFMDVSFELLYQVLDSDIYINAHESEIFGAIVRWIRHDKSNREHGGKTLLQKIRYCLLSLAELQEVADDVKKHDDIKQLVDEAIQYQSDPVKQCLQSSAATQVRGAQDVLVLFTAMDDLTQIQYKIPGSEGFLTETIDTCYADSLFEFASMCVLGNFLFVAGGYERRNYCSSPAFYCYDPRQRSWLQLESMIQPRVSFNLISGERGVYAVAGIEHMIDDGRDKETILDLIEYYSPESGQWTEYARLPVGRFGTASVMVDNTLYVTGGISDDPEDTVPVTHVTAIRDRNVTTLSSLLTARQGHAIAAVNCILLVCGGYTANESAMGFAHCNTNEMYDIETGQWSLLSSIEPNVGHIHHAAALLQGQLYVLGGKTPKRFLHAFHREAGEVENGEYCGLNVVQLHAMNVALPPELL